MRLKDADKQLGPSVVREDYEPTRYNRPIQEKKVNKILATQQYSLTTW